MTQYVVSIASGQSMAISVTALSGKYWTLEAKHPLFSMLKQLVQAKASLEKIEQLFEAVSLAKNEDAGGILSEIVLDQDSLDPIALLEVLRQRIEERNKTAQQAFSASGPFASLEAEEAARQFNLSADGTLMTFGVPGTDPLKVPAAVIAKALVMMKEGFSIEPLRNFLNRLLRNPSYRVREELFAFLTHGDIPLTEDGRFLAYKAVRSDYYDIYSGTLLNTVGSVVEMPRSQVDDNSERTCSAGLHVCSRDYLPSFAHSNGHVMICEIDPADVVSIPRDYNNTKMRCCRYTVVGEWEGYYQEKKSQTHFLGQASVMTGTEVDGSSRYVVRFIPTGAFEDQWQQHGDRGYAQLRQAYAAFNDFIDSTEDSNYITVEIYDRHTQTSIEEEEGSGDFSYSQDDATSSMPDTGWGLFHDDEFLSDYGSFPTRNLAIGCVMDNDLLTEYTVLQIRSFDSGESMTISADIE